MKKWMNLLKEDATDKMKHEKLSEIDKVVSMLAAKVEELSQLDNADGSSGRGDLHDQLVTFDKALKALQGVASRSHGIVPENTNEAVGEFAEPIYDLVDIEGEEAVLDELIRYLDGDTIRDFVADYKRHHDMNNMDEGEEAGPKEIDHNKPVDLAGDSIWQGEKRNEPVTTKVNVGKIKVATDEDGYLSVHVEHDGPWTIYTDSGFEEQISAIVGSELSWSEQGMQEEGMAHLEGDAANESKQEHTMEELDRILAIAGLAKAPVAEEVVNEKCDCDDPECDDPKVHEAVEETVEEGKYGKKKKYESEEELEEAKKELDEEPNEGNEFAHELKKARDAGKKEFEVDGKKYKVESEESDEEVVAEAPTMDTTQLINLLKNSGLSEEKIAEKLDEWANTPAGVGEEAPTDHGDAYEVAQMVNLSLKRYLDAQDAKVTVSESHTSEEMKAKYQNYKTK